LVTNYGRVDTTGGREDEPTLIVRGQRNQIRSKTGSDEPEGLDADTQTYRFLVDGEEVATASTRYLSTEVADGFTGVTIGPCATGRGRR